MQRAVSEANPARQTGEDVTQHPDARRVGITVGLDRFDQQGFRSRGISGRHLNLRTERLRLQLADFATVILTGKMLISRDPR